MRYDDNAKVLNEKYGVKIREWSEGTTDLGRAFKKYCADISNYSNEDVNTIMSNIRAVKGFITEYLHVSQRDIEVIEGAEEFAGEILSGE